MKNNIAYIATETTITVIFEGKNRTIQVKSKAHRNDVVKALEIFKKSKQSDKDKELLEKFLSPIKRIELESDNRFELDHEDNKLYLTGSKVPVEVGLADKILDFLDNGLSVDPLVKFWESCLKNPHFVAVQELFKFLERNQLPLTEDGAFLGYKKLNFKGSVSIPEEFEELFVDDKGEVRTTKGQKANSEITLKYLEFINNVNNPLMVDVHSGTIKQRLGEVVKIDRVKFNEEERRNACGYGLHIGAFSYCFGGNVRVLCKVFPEDVIACNPNEEKLRTCKYQIVSFVDSAKEIKDLLVDLSKELEEFDFQEEESENTFSEGEIVKATESISDEISEGTLYYITNVDGDDICVINDLGEEEWYDFESFEDRA